MRKNFFARSSCLHVYLVSAPKVLFQKNLKRPPQGISYRERERQRETLYYVAKLNRISGLPKKLKHQTDTNWRADTCKAQVGQLVINCIYCFNIKNRCVSLYLINTLVLFLGNGHSRANLANSSTRRKFAILGKFEYSPKWPFLEMCRTRQTCRRSPTWFARTRQTCRHSPTWFAWTCQTHDCQVLQVLSEFGEFGKFSECMLDRFIQIKYVICAQNNLPYHAPTVAKTWQVLASLADIRQALLRGLARLADICQAVLRGLDRLADICQRQL